MGLGKHLSVSLIALSAGTASAGEFYSYASGNLWASAPGFQNANVNGYSNPSGSGQFVGNFTPAAVATPDSLVKFFCVELSQFAAVPGPVTYRLDGSGGAWTSTGVYDNLRRLYDIAYANPAQGDFWDGASQTTFGALDSGLAAAFQLAVWEIVFDTGLDVTNATGGSFKDLGGSTGVAQAQAWLNGVGAYAGTGYTSWNLYRLKSDSNQDYVTATHTVTEPDTLGLATLALAGLGVVARRRRR